MYGDNANDGQICKDHAVVFVAIQTTYHGFPDGPTALTFDSESRILVIGTKSGELRAYGRPGVEFKADSDSGSEIKHLFVIAGLHQIISVAADNCILSWELSTEGKPTLSLIKQFKLDSDGYVHTYVCVYMYISCNS